MKHLTREQRYTISTMKKQGYKQKEIALTIERDKSVVSREFKRNCDKRSKKYEADLAQRKYEQRQRDKPKHIRFTDEVKQCVDGLLEKDRVDIEQRPTIVEDKKRLGDLEIDTVIGQNHKGALLTINDRVSSMVWIAKLNGKNADELAQKTIEVLNPYKNLTNTITGDNGKEFAEHKIISTGLDVDFYFAKPYHSWERGANENTNGLIRQYFPKGSSFENVSIKDVQRIQDILNNRPRKKLSFFTPNEFLSLYLSNQKVAFVT